MENVSVDVGGEELRCGWNEEVLHEMKRVEGAVGEWVRELVLEGAVQVENVRRIERPQ